MFYRFEKNYIWVSDEFTLDETITYLIKKLSHSYQIINREKIRQLVLGQNKNLA